MNVDGLNPVAGTEEKMIVHRITKRRRFGVNVGSSSILLIFVVLCLVTFAVLSVVSAQVDYNLSKKLAARNMKYYEACGEAEEFLGNLVVSLKEIEAQSANEQEYFAQAGESSQFSIELTKQQRLEVQVQVLYPPRDGAYYKLNSWQVVIDDNLELDDTLELPGEEDLQFLF
ncbi:MAG: hypothetical protein K5641_02630 [Lachnospiraceae bacterium]|nr:hypothetical protein [Lachnospiraceae bacterium]